MSMSMETRFRYPDSRSSQAQNWLGGNFFALKLAVSEVDLFGFGFRSRFPRWMQADLI